MYTLKLKLFFLLVLLSVTLGSSNVLAKATLDKNEYLKPLAHDLAHSRLTKSDQPDNDII